MSTTYEPLDQVRKSFRVRWYRSPVERDVLRGLTRRSDVKGFLQAGGHLALLVLTGFLVFRAFGQRRWAEFGVFLWIHGIIMTFLTLSSSHELSHNTVFKTKWRNRFFLLIISIPGWFNPFWYDISHTYHHLYTLFPRGDREVTLPREPSLRFGYLLQLFTVNIFGGYNSIGLVPAVVGTVRLAVAGSFGGAFAAVSSEWIEAIFTPDKVAERKKAVAFARFLVLFHLSVIVVSVVFKLWPLMLVVTFGTFIGNWLRYFVGVPMHTGLRDNVADFRKCSRTIRLDPLTEFLYWRMNWHIEHHMYAAVPCYHLRRLHRVIADDLPEPRTLIGSWREMRAIWKKQREDPGYQYDTPVPGDRDKKP